MKFQSRLKQIRKQRDLSQRDVARLMNLPPSSISHFESGRRMPNFKNLIALADALAVSLDFLCLQTDKMAYGGTLLNFDEISKLSQKDQNLLAGFVEILANKNKNVLAG